MTATSKESIYEAALDAVRALTGNDVYVRVLVDRPGRAQLLARGVRRRRGPTTRARAAPALATARRDGRRRCCDSDSVDSPREQTARSAAPGLRRGGRQRLRRCPLFIKDELRGLLVVGSSERADPAIRDGLEALASQVALALESAVLTEDLLRQRSEARFSSLVQNSSDVVAVIEPDTTIRYVSPSVERVPGFKPGRRRGHAGSSTSSTPTTARACSASSRTPRARRSATPG